MQSNIYVGLSAQLALQRRLDTVANNVANSSTAGFRAEQMSFEELLSKSGQTAVSFVSKGQSYLSTQGGELTQTDNPLDIAVRGDAWLSIQTPTGTAYTRDGRMKMRADGVLTNLMGDPFLDAGGTPIQLDPDGGTITINKAGTIEQDGNNLGAFGLYALPQGAKLTRAQGSSVVSDQPAVPEIDFLRTGVVQGYVEKSNVNPILEMTHLTTLQRSFDAVSNVLRETESSLQDSLKTLAGS
jgi:flagellar basal-body rod protein FlgF